MNKQEFAKSYEFVDAVEKATLAGFSGSGYSVEFFVDGSYRLLWDNQIGNGYEHPTSEIISVPQLSQEQVSECDEDNGEGMREVIRFYQDELAEEFLRDY